MLTTRMTTSTTKDRFEVVFEITDGRDFKNYLLAVWDIPREFADANSETNAKEMWIVENTDGDFRAILLFDLKPEIRVWLKLLKAASSLG